MSEHTLASKNQSGIEGELELTREEVRAIKKLAEQEMINTDDYAYSLGGSNWADLDNLRTKCKLWLVKNQ